MRKVIHKVLFIANLFFAFALLFSYLASFVNPDLFVLPSLFGLAYPYILLINVIFMIIWASFLKWEIVISLIAILIGFSHFSNFIRLKRPDSSTEGTFKIISYNVRLFNYYESVNNNTEEKVLSFLGDEEADILCLQELFSNRDIGREDYYIRQTLGDGYFSHTKFIGKESDRRYGIATYSKYRIINKGEVFHPNSSSLTIFSDIVIEQDTFRIFNNHLQSFKLKSMERSFLEEIDVKEISLNLRNGFKQRSIQATMVKDEIKRSPYPVIVLGDFNDTPLSYSYHKLRKGLKDAFIESGYGAGFTYKGVYPANRIDYILYDNLIECKSFDILKIGYSDHYPVRGYFIKREKP